MNYFEARNLVKGRKEYLKWMDTKPKNWHDCTSWCLVYPDGYRMTPHYACFSGLGSGCSRYNDANNNYKDNHKHGNGSVALIVGIHSEFGSNGDLLGKGKIAFIDWLANRSPWAEAFITKDAKSIDRHRCAILSTTVAGNIMGGAGVTLRRLWETTFIANNWYEFVKVGVPEDLAWWLAHCASKGGDSLRFSRSGAGHEALNHNFNKEGLINFLTHNPNKMGSYSEKGIYTQYSAMFGGSGDEWGEASKNSAQQWLIDNFPWREGAVKKITNPFAKAVVAKDMGPMVEYAKGLEILSSWWPKVYEYVGFPIPGQVTVKVNNMPRDAKGRFVKKEKACA